MQINLNGELYELAQIMNVREFVASLNLNTTQVAVERNREIVARSLYDKVMLEEGDNIEIVTFIGGG